MAVTLTTVTGSMELPDGTTPRLGRVIFTLTGWARNAPHLFVKGSVDVAAGADGSFSVSLQTTDDLDVEYDVVFSHHDTSLNRDVSTPVGRILVPASGPVTLASLLPVRIPAGAKPEATFKRGDTINMGGQWLDGNDRPLDLTGLTLSCAMMGPDGVTRPLMLIVLDAAAGLTEITLAASDSAALPLGLHQIDVKLSSGARVSRTQTGFINIIEEITP
ncbi:MAG TPA: hypothetical protein PKE59_00160 [Novosphingobium sp.]|jgi:hypothetical protein|nr:hypothetical protein [Novosphingobium sp.]